MKKASGVAAWIGLLTIPFWSLFFISRARSSVFIADFKSDFPGWKKELCCTHSAQIVSSPTHTGKNAVKFTLNRGDPYIASRPRAELRLKPVPANSEWTYRFSLLIPTNNATDPSYEIVAQWHEQPDFDSGETWRRPPLTLSIRNNQFGVSNRWDPKPVSVIFKEAGSQSWKLGEVAKGKWTDWVFHVKWSYKSDGLLEVWKNGKLVVRKTGPNTYNDKRGPYFKIGIYKPDWKSAPQKSITTQRVVYYGQVQIEQE